MADEHLVAALDIGTTKICALVGEMDKEGRVYIVGHGTAPAEGLRRGVVVDMEKTVRSITKAVGDAGMVSGTEVDCVTVGIAGEHIRSINSHGVIAVNRSDNEITDSDVRKAIEAARAVAIPVDRDIIHVIPQEFAVDDQPGIKDPIGMSGVRLEVEAHIVTASVTTARTLYRALERCQLEVDHIVLESLALSESLLTADEIEAGVVVVDIGGDLTNISVFFDGAVRHTAVVSLGSRNITNDIAIGLRTTVDRAETLKLTSGAALRSHVNANDMIVVPTAGGTQEKEISRTVLTSIIEPRMEEILSLAVREIRKANADALTGGVVLTGGGVLLPGTTELAEQMFDMPVRAGQVTNIDHIPDDMMSLRFATACGLVLYGLHNEPVRNLGAGKVRGFMKKFEKWISKQF